MAKGLVYAVGGFVTAIFGIVGYSIYKQAMLAKQMRITFAGASMLPMQSGNIGLNLTLNVTNISALTINVTNLNFDVYINDKYINKVIQNTNQVIIANATSQVSFNIYFNIATILGSIDLSSILKNLNLNSINIKLIGYVSGAVDGIDVSNLPFQIQENLGQLIQ